MKMTEREILNYLAEATSSPSFAVDADKIAVINDYCKRCLTALDNKAEKAKERAALHQGKVAAKRDKIYHLLTNYFQSADEILAKCDEDMEMTRSRVVMLLNQLVDANLAEKTVTTIKNPNNKNGRSTINVWALAEGGYIE